MKYSIVGAILLYLVIPIGYAVGNEARVCNSDYTIQDNVTRLNIYPENEELFASNEEYKRWERRCMLPLQKLDHLDKPYQLVDIRDPHRFSENSIRQSINIPVHRIKAKPFLKSKKIILLSDGYERVNMIKACKTLSETGYDAHVLEGGLVSWLEGAKDVQGLYMDERLYSIPPDKFHNESRYRRWIVIDLTTGLSKKLMPYIDTIHSFDHYPNAQELNKLIKRMAKTDQDIHDLSIVVIDSDGMGFGGFKQWRKSILPQLEVNNLFYMASGLAGFEDFAQKQRAILNKLEFTLLNPEGCSR